MCGVGGAGEFVGAELQFEAHAADVQCLFQGGGLGGVHRRWCGRGLAGWSGIGLSVGRYDQQSQFSETQVASKRLGISLSSGFPGSLAAIAAAASAVGAAKGPNRQMSSRPSRAAKNVAVL